MNRFIIKAFILGIINLLLFFIVFHIFKNNSIYKNTLGKISKNYEKSGDFGNFEIKQVTKPYIDINNNNLENIDAGIYKCIRDKGYTTAEGCYDKVRGAFFPLFPGVWWLLHVDTRSICVFNYLLFVLALALLVYSLNTGSGRDKLILFVLSITIPSSIIYYLPYTESVFLFTMTIAVIGILKNNYRLYFMGILLLALSRPASIFLLLAILLIDTVTFLNDKNIKFFLKKIILKALPFLLAYFLVMLIQFLFSSSWTYMLDAQKFWEGNLQLPRKIADWSVEGFGISSFSIFVICIPVTIYTLSQLIKYERDLQGNGDLFSYKKGNAKDYLFLLSATYLSGMLLFVSLFSGGNLHSFFRFTLASPLFYIILFLYREKLIDLSIGKKVLMFFAPVLCLIIFLNVVEYGGERINFQLAGMYLFVIFYAFYLFYDYLTLNVRVIILALLWISGTVWTTYLLNMFLSEAWVFT